MVWYGVVWCILSFLSQTPLLSTVSPFDFVLILSTLICTLLLFSLFIF